jgi:hypothetical protein
MTAAELLAVLDCRGYRTRGNRAQCPVCQSRRLDLIVSDGDTATLVHCHRRNCTREAIATALEIDSRAFFNFSLERFDTSRRSNGDSLRSSDSLRVVQLLAAHELGALNPVEIRMSLPPRARRIMRAVGEDLELLFGLRLAVLDKRPLPYAAGLAARRLGEDKRNVGRALRSLTAYGAIGRAGTLRGPEGRKGIVKYRLPSDLLARLDLPSLQRAREAAARVAAVGSVEPFAELHHHDRVRAAELRGPLVVGAKRGLGAMQGRADRVVHDEDDRAPRGGGRP